MLSPGNENAPSALVTADCVKPVEGIVTVTSAPGSTAPLESTAMPESVEVVPP